MNKIIIELLNKLDEQKALIKQLEKSVVYQGTYIDLLTGNTIILPELFYSDVDAINYAKEYYRVTNTTYCFIERKIH